MFNQDRQNSEIIHYKQVTTHTIQCNAIQYTIQYNTTMITISGLFVFDFVSIRNKKCRLFDSGLW